MSISTIANDVLHNLPHEKSTIEDIIYQVMEKASQEDIDTALYKIAKSEVNKKITQSNLQFEKEQVQASWIPEYYDIPVSIGDGFVQPLGDIGHLEIELLISRRESNAQAVSKASFNYRVNMTPIMICCAENSINVRKAVSKLGLEKPVESET